MKKPTVKYSKGEIGRVRIVEDFLPSSDRLVREDNVKVTLSLSQRSVVFQARRATAPRALPAHDPRASGRLRGEAGRKGVTTGGMTSYYSPPRAIL